MSALLNYPATGWQLLVMEIITRVSQRIARAMYSPLPELHDSAPSLEVKA